MSALAGAVAFGGLYLHGQDVTPTSVLRRINTTGLFTAMVPGAVAPTDRASDADTNADAVNAGQPTTSPLDSMAAPVFRATQLGALVIDPQTRTDVERVYALYQRDEAMQKLAAFSAELPAKAQRELRDLFQQYAQYAQAVAQTFPPDQNVSSTEEVSRQLKGLHDLRQQYFGVDGARVMFEQEEETSAKLISLMSQNKGSGLSLSDKAEQAQEAIKP